MTSELIMKSDVLDILFENRNKEYGAYPLRRFYNTRLIYSVGLMVGAVMAFSAFTFISTNTGQINFIVEEQEFGSVSPQPKVTAPRQEKKKVSKAPPKTTQKLVSTIMILQKNDSADILRDLSNLVIGSKTVILPNNEEAQPEFPASTGVDSDHEPVQVAEPAVEPARPIENPEIMPQYPGEMEALHKFLSRNLRNPEIGDARDFVSVKVKFVVGYNGKLQHFELEEDGGSEFNNEVIRVLKKMPDWIPGKTKGKNVSVYYTIPVKFIQEH